MNGKKDVWVKLPVLAAILTCMAGAHAQSPAPNPKLWVPDGPVRAIVHAGDTTYIGGLFSHVGPATGCGVPLDTATGLPVGTFPKINGEVTATAPDGSGGWYVGGYLIQVGDGLSRKLIHILADGTLDPNWNPNPTNGGVYAILASGPTVYIGGDFQTIGGQWVPGLAAIDAVTGNVTDWRPTGLYYGNYQINAFAMHGTTLFVGGYAYSYGDGLVALDTVTGEVVAGWRSVISSGEVRTLAVSGDTIYAGGSFSAGYPRNNLVAFDVLTGAVRDWNPSVDGRVYALAVSDSVVYAGGEFTSIGGQPRSNIAALDRETGSATDWNPGADDRVNTLAISGETVYTGGYFTRIGGEPRSNMAALDAATGRATAWNPQPNKPVSILSISGTTVYAGGWFMTLGGQPRSCLAAFDTATGALKDWNPVVSPESYYSTDYLFGTGIYTLAVLDETVYLGGFFLRVGGQDRLCLAAVHAETGEVSDWNPNADSMVRSLAISGSTVYAGGWFTSVGGLDRRDLAAIDAVTGEVSDWNPNVQGNIYALAASGSTLYAGGLFSINDGKADCGLAAIEMGAGAGIDWNLSTSDIVWSLAVSGSTVYAGGWFTSMGGQARKGLAAIDAGTGLVTEWQADVNGNVYALAPVGTTLYAGGGSVNYGGFEVRSHIAAIEMESGVSSTWSPFTNGYVGALAVSEKGVSAGGSFVNVNSYYQPNFARFDFPIPPHTVTYTAGAGGAIAGESPQTVAHGADATAVEAVPAEGHHFVQWSDGSVENPRTDMNVTADLAVTAEFAVNTYTLTYTAGLDGSIAGESPQTVAHGADGAAVEAVPEVGHHFVQWSDGVLTATRADLNVTADLDVTAEFAVNTYTLTYTAGAGGALAGVSPQTVSHGGNGLAVTAFAEDWHHFVQWSDGVLTATRTDLNVTANVDVTAEFAVNTYTLSYTAGAGGSILGAAAQTVPYGSGGTAVEAVAAEGYHFVQWSDGSVENPRLDVNVTVDLEVTAEFAVNTYTLSYTAGAGGAITGVATQTVAHGSGGTAVEAVPEEGYHFVQWSDGSVENPRLDLEVTADLAVTAEFAVDSPEGEGEGEGEGEPPVPPTAEEARALLAAGFDAADTDRDGHISFAEAAAFVEGLTRAVFDELDANADEMLDRAELGLDVDDGCGCGCVKSDFSPAGLKKRLGDLFLAGLALGLLAAWGARRK